MSDLSKITSEAAQRLKETLNQQEESTEETTDESVEELDTSEEVPEEQTEEVPEVEETVDEEPEKKEELSSKEAALLKEIARLKAERREKPFQPKLEEISPNIEENLEQVEVTPALAEIYNAWRDEALEEFLDKNPKYKTDTSLWDRFSQEYSERLPELVYAKRKGIKVTKGLFKERLNRVHLSLGEDTSKAKEEGKKELLKAQSAASVMSAGNAKNSQLSEKPAPKKLLFTRNTNGFEAWKKNK